MPVNQASNRAFGIIGATLGLLVVLLLFSGCSGPARITDNGTSETPLTAQPLPAAPRQLYIEAGQQENFTYWGHTIAVNYASAFPSQKILVAIDGSERLITRNLTDSPKGIDWSEANLSFTLKPVIWEMRNGQKVPLYERTWDTREVYFITTILLPPPGVTGGLVR